MKYVLLLVAVLAMNYSFSQKSSSDVALHFGTGSLISGLTYTLVYNKTKNKSKAFWYSFGLSTLAGFAKEFYDGHIISVKFDNREFLATAAGGLTASVGFNIFTGKRKKQKEEEKLAILKSSISQQYLLLEESP